jgi:hypothetical protein
MYALYTVILFNLSNAKYYQDVKDLTDANMHAAVVNILIYDALELLSMVHVYLMVKRHFGVSVFYQVVFSLETEWRIYQCYFKV